MNRQWVMAAMAALGIAACRQAPAAVPGADRPAAPAEAARPVGMAPPVQTATDPADGLGVVFDKGAGLETRPCEGDAPRCLTLFDPAAESFMRDLLTVQVHDGPLETVAAAEAGFERDADGRLMTTYGRFEPVPVQSFTVDGQAGLRAVVTCGISDPETGFHAGAGECLWAAVSDGRRTVIVSTSGFANGLEAAEPLLKSLRFQP